jgi:hypothetical protein
MANIRRFFLRLLIPFGMIAAIVSISRPWTETSTYHVARSFVVKDADISRYYSEVFHYVSAKEEGVVLDASAAGLNGDSKKTIPLHIRSDRRLATIRHPYLALVIEVFRLTALIAVIPTIMWGLFSFYMIPNRPLSN